MLAGQLADARERLTASYEGLSPDDMIRRGVAEDWSVRDILAHLSAWDRETTRTYRAMLEGEHPHFLEFSDEEIQAFNEKNHEAMKGMSLEQVLAELDASREEMLDLLREVDNIKLFAPAPGDEHADLSIAACLQVSISHDEEHAEMIENWRDEQGL
jgi:uncharacterized protein (TIGR03083 family)